MVAFRKLFPALGVIGLLFGSVSAFAQSPLACQANSGVPPTVRAEGLTELLGDLVITCRGGNPAQPFLANFQIFLNTNVTSRLGGDGSTYDALLMIDEPGLNIPFCVSPATASNPTNSFPVNPSGGITGTIGAAADTCPGGSTYNGASIYQTGSYNVFRGVRPAVSSDNSVLWQGIPVLPPGTNNSRTFRITNIRGNASSIGTTSSGLPNQIIAFISVNPQSTLAIDNPQQTVGYVQTGLLFDTRNCNNSGGRNSNSFFQCASSNADRFNTPTSGTLPSNSTSGDTILGLRFREGYPTAFKIRLATGQPNSLPNTSFNSESGFVNPATGTAGIADTGTRLMARFANVPTGIRLFVSTSNVTSVGTANARAVLVSTDANGASFTNLGTSTTAPTAIPGAITLACSGVTYDATGANAVEVPLSGGSGQAVWEVTAADTSNYDTLFFQVAFAYVANAGSNTPGLGQSTVTGTFAPLFTAANAGTATFAPIVIPRFTAGTAAPTNLFLISACSTNLLFPFVTNQAGFDTGIAISNTSQDPFATGNSNNGRCTLNYYGSLPNGAPLTTSSERTDRDVNAGQTLTMVLSTGGGFGLKGNPNMQGYIIAQCDFRFGHGFAFITDGPIGQARVAEGYLAIVLDGVNSVRGNKNGEEQGN